MAYSDYGGYAYRNGERVLERSDWTLTPDGGFGTPGSWPGFALIAAGRPEAEVRELVNRPHFHAALGDGPLYVGLYKQSTVQLYLGMDQGDLDPLVRAKYPDAVKPWTFREGDYVDDDYFRDKDIPCVVEVDGHTLSIRHTHEDNYYVYAELRQPDGVVWHGFSGYGVGAGLEDCGYGFSTGARERMLWSFFERPRVPAL